MMIKRASAAKALPEFNARVQTKTAHFFGKQIVQGFDSVK